VVINDDTLMVYVGEIEKPDTPTLQSAFGTTPPHPSNNEDSAAWFDGFGANSNSEYFEVMVRIHRRMYEFGMYPYQAHWPVWYYGDPLTQDSSGYCVDGEFRYNERCESLLSEVPYSFLQTMGTYLFQTRPGVWAPCGVRQDRATPEEWQQVLQTFYSESKDYNLLSYVDEPFGTIWTDETKGLAATTMRAAYEYGNGFAATLPNLSYLDKLADWDAPLKRYIFNASQSSELPDATLLDNLPDGSDYWYYAVWNGFMYVDGKTGNRSEPADDLAEDMAIRCWQDGAGGLLYWRIISPEATSHWNDQAHWIDPTWKLSKRFWLLREDLFNLHAWLTAASALHGRETVAGYISGYHGEDIRYMLYQLCAIVEPSTVEEALRTYANHHQCISPNPDAALQKAIYAAGMVPTSNEFSYAHHDGTQWIGQRAESLTSPTNPTVFYVLVPEWGSVYQIPAEVD
jgi:hypothetical protein